MKLLTTIVLMTLSAFTFANETPKQYPEFSIVTKEVNDELNKTYGSMIDKAIDTIASNDTGYSAADVKAVVDSVATEYSPCKYKRQIDLLECKSIRNKLVTYLTDSVLHSPKFKKVTESKRLEFSKILEYFERNDVNSKLIYEPYEPYEPIAFSLADRVKKILRQGEMIDGIVTFNSPDLKQSVKIISLLLPPETISNLYEEILIADLNDYIKRVEGNLETRSTYHHGILNTAVRFTVKVNNFVLSRIEYTCKYNQEDTTIKCDPMLTLWKWIFIFIMAIWLLFEITSLVKETNIRRSHHDIIKKLEKNTPQD